MKDESLLLKPADAAVLLSMSKSKIYDAIARRDIPCVRVAGMLRIPKVELQKLITQQLTEQSHQ